MARRLPYKARIAPPPSLLEISSLRETRVDLVPMSELKSSPAGSPSTQMELRSEEIFSYGKGITC